MPFINQASAVAPARQIAMHYRERIESGDLQPGDQLPSTPTAAIDWGVSTATVRAALDLLRNEGLIASQQGRGVFVRQPPRRIRRDARAHQRSKDLAREPEEVRREFGAAEADLGVAVVDLRFQCECTSMTPPPDIADALEMAADEVVVRKTYRTFDPDSDLLAQHSVVWVPQLLIEGNPALLDPDQEPWPGGGTHQLSTVGIEIDRVDDLVTATMPTPTEQTAWGLVAGVPMLRTRSTIYDTAGRVVTVSDAIYPGDRTELAFTTQLERW